MVAMSGLSAANFRNCSTACAAAISVTFRRFAPNSLSNKGLQIMLNDEAAKLKMEDVPGIVFLSPGSKHCDGVSI